MISDDSELRLRGQSLSSYSTNLLYENDSKTVKNLINKQQQTSNQKSSLSLENICWLVASIVCLYITDIINVIFWDDRINRSLLYASVLLISVNILIGIYCIIFGNNSYLIPIATACFVFGSIILTISLWPVYSWLTAPILFTIFMGFIVVIINIPI